MRLKDGHLFEVDDDKGNDEEEEELMLSEL